MTAGVERLESIDLASVGRSPIPELFGWVVTPAKDGAGNSWILELAPGQQTLGSIWFVCHDAPALLYQSRDLASFVEDYVHRRRLANRAAVAKVASQSIDLPREALLAASDPVLRDFAARLEQGWFIRDLRDAQTGDGMPLGCFGRTTPLARAGTEPVFAYGSRSGWQRFVGWFTGR